jgi:SAM-dependent methyltransferase
MDRRAWLAERRAAVEADYDAGADTFDVDAYPRGSHEKFVRRLLDTCPSDATILDAPCGTGRYFPLVRGAGRHVVGADQSTGMLAQARARGLASRLDQVGLQELSFDAEFDGAMTIDAMENVPPEEWPLVLANLHRAIRPGAHLYLTVEEADDARIEAGLAHARELGLPAIRGEVTEDYAAGYHYYPDRERVMAWFADEGLEPVAERFDQEDGWGYRHWLLRDPRPSP